MVRLGEYFVSDAGSNCRFVTIVLLLMFDLLCFLWFIVGSGFTALCYM